MRTDKTPEELKGKDWTKCRIIDVGGVFNGMAFDIPKELADAITANIQGNGIVIVNKDEKMLSEIAEKQKNELNSGDL